MRDQSLKVKFLFKISLALALVFVALMVLFYMLFKTEFSEAVHEKGEALSFTIREKGQNNLEMYGQDPANLEALSLDLQRLTAARGEIAYARIVHVDGRVAASNDLDAVGSIINLNGSGKGGWMAEAGPVIEVYTPIPGSQYFVQIAIESARYSRKLLRTIFILCMLGAGALLIVYLIVHYTLRESIQIPLGNLSRDAARVAAGDLTLTFERQESGQDEIGRLAGSLAAMTDGLRGMVSRIEGMTSNVSLHFRRLLEDSDTLGAAIRQQNQSLLASMQNMENFDANTGIINVSLEDLFVVSQETSSFILEIGGSIEEVESHVAQLSHAVAETSSSILEISRSIAEVADRSKALAKNADDMSGALREISTTITHVEQNAQQNTELSKDVSLTAKDGLESVEKSGASMGRIKVSVQETAEVISQLGLRSQEIGEIVTVINQVTEKTNLLALNAAIIAAAAGEQGAGFAVVADGIRDLARQVAAKTREIEGLVQGVQKETRKAEERVTSGLTMVEEGEQLSSAAQQKLVQIYEASLRSEEMSHLISTAMAEQRKNTQALAESSTRVAQISHQIAVATEQEASASNQIQRSVTQMEELANNVLHRTHEQSEGSRRISEAVGRIGSSVQAINDITVKHKGDSEAVLTALQSSQTALTENNERLDALRSTVKEADKAVGDLGTEISKFKMK